MQDSKKVITEHYGVPALLISKVFHCVYRSAVGLYAITPRFAVG
jgi:hypothetical protein